jgi:hypothetical protein
MFDSDSSEDLTSGAFGGIGSGRWIMKASRPCTRLALPLRTLVGVFDEDVTPSHTHNDPLLDIQGPITKARARQLNLEVSSFLCNSLYDFENRLLPNDYIVLRNEREV